MAYHSRKQGGGQLLGRLCPFFLEQGFNEGFWDGLGRGKVRSKLRKSPRTIANPKSPESLNHQQIHQILCNSQRFNTESSSLNRLLHNTSANPSLLATDSSTITKKTVRRRGKENEED
ncbi:hypothetical protein MTR_3g016355 [Medicago truncatula]|uniref:Uncharacterized protein n=1 Tax=Medicago truncatula TaxID=3880 RepID=A0A072UUJ8_MEDTR|nr:hypothetical protein MTR_3g016355 [Medicago truncatula]